MAGRLYGAGGLGHNKIILKLHGHSYRTENGKIREQNTQVKEKVKTSSLLMTSSGLLSAIFLIG